MFISFEGVEGSGKSTQLVRLKNYLEQRGRTVVCTREPGGTEIGESIRGLLLGQGNRMSEGTELFLMMSSRHELVKQVIRPALKAGHVVLSDRFVDASFAYQGFARGVPLKMVQGLARWACGDSWPQKTLLFDIDAAAGLARSLPLKKPESESGQGDRIESCGPRFMEKVRKGYLELAKGEPDRISVIPVTGNQEDTFEAVIAALGPLLEE